jgi:mono/diheme cytochrome c family protein
MRHLRIASRLLLSLSSAFGAVALLAGSAVVVATGGGPQATGTPKINQDPMVTPVSGPSWLNRLGVRLDQTTLGRTGATYRPPPDQQPAGVPAIPLQIGRPVTLTGADLYRLNCQACHRAEGTGAQPEIKSVFAAVQGSSLALVRQRMQQTGRAGGAAEARTEANRAHADLITRIKKGGQRMPPLSHLRDADIAAVYAYLTELSGVPDAPAAAPRTVSWARLGELVVKGTCHICHDAVGPRPSNQALAQGTVPPFTVLLQDKPVVDFLRKVRTGSAVTSGDAAFHYRGRMPVFPYLRDIDVAAAYMFLVEYPPSAGQ